jgi:hypothetical protein
LHPMFDIQGVHKVMNPTAKDRTVWLVDVQAQLVYNLEKHKGNTRKMLTNIERNNPTLRSGTGFGFDDNISWQQDH